MSDWESLAGERGKIAVDDWWLPTREEFASMAEGLEVNRYYDVWRLLLMLWRMVYRSSPLNKGRYRPRIWTMFSERVAQAARTTGDLERFLGQVSKLLMIPEIGANEDDRQELLRLVALSDGAKREIMRQLREDTPLLTALVRRWRDMSSEERRRERAAREEKP